MAAADHGPRVAIGVLALSLMAVACAHDPAVAATSPALTSKLLIVRARGGQLDNVLARQRLTLVERLAWDPAGDDVALVRVVPLRSAERVASVLPVVDPAVKAAEAVAVATLPETGSIAVLEQSTMAVLDALGSSDTAALGTGPDGALRRVWSGYSQQPAAQLTRLAQAHRLATGRGAVVAVVDTGIDPTNPLFAGQLLPGWDFVEERSGASEREVVDQSTMAVLDQSTMAVLDRSTRALIAAAEPVEVNPSTTALLAPGTGDALDVGALPPAFGHGTMVAGVVHLVAPDAGLMPLRAFDAAGFASTFDLIQAIYHAVRNGATVLNLSFSLPTYSRELETAIAFAARQGVIAVASAGNDGAALLVYPAALAITIGVAATDHDDAVAPFSNFGNHLVELAAPGVSVVTTYPGGGWAAASGTSFAAPWVSGAAALLAERAAAEGGAIRLDGALEALSNAAPVQGLLAPWVGFGRLDLEAATASFTLPLGAVAPGSANGRN